MANTKIFLLI